MSIQESGEGGECEAGPGGGDQSEPEQVWFSFCPLVKQRGFGLTPL